MVKVTPFMYEELCVPKPQKVELVVMEKRQRGKHDVGMTDAEAVYSDVYVHYVCITSPTVFISCYQQHCHT